MNIPIRSSQIIKVDHLVIGAGVVGLAIAERLSRKSKSILLIDQNSTFGSETSSRNSEVIHAGIYYPLDSLKTKLCIRGRELMYNICKKHGIRHANIGKWIVSAHRNEDADIERIKSHADALNVPTHYLSYKEAQRIEPNVIASTVLVSPTTGIIDSHHFMSYLSNTFIEQGGDVSYHTKAHIIQKHPSSHGFLIQIQKDIWVHSQTVVNSTGLHAHSKDFKMNTKSIPSIYYCKGHYVGYRGPSLVSRPIYPIPEKNVKSLGIHCTLDLSGKLKFGPDVVYTDKLDYGLQAKDEQDLIHKFHYAVSRYLKGVDRDRMYYDYCGIRPKLSGPNDSFKDFIISHEPQGYISLYGIESPGLTSSLAIAEYIDNLL